MESWYYSWVPTSDVQLFDFVNDRLFLVYFILQNQRTVDWFLRNKSTLQNFRFGLFGNLEEPAVSLKQLAQNPQLEKPSFENFKKIENLGSTPEPSFKFFFSPQLGDCICTQVIISKYL